MIFRIFLIALVVPVADVAVVSAGDESVVTQRINQHLEKRWKENGTRCAPRCDDEYFVRRVFLDLVGRVPTVVEKSDFTNDESPDKRRNLIWTLTDSDEYATHFAQNFDALLMGRGTESEYEQRRTSGWLEYLRSVFRDNRAWNQVVEEIVVARPRSQVDRGQVWFLYERNDQYQEIAEAVAPAVFGIRIECAQCHDHPLADEILQSHYWGMVAFFNRSKNSNTKNGPRVSESAIGGFSEFADLTGQSTPNLLTFLLADQVEEARPEKDAKEEDREELYVPASLQGDPRVPRFSRRKEFAEKVVRSHPLVPRAMVNRIWGMLMGRGLVHPIDEMDSVHRPSHPQLLDWLTTDFERSGFDIRRLVRAIVSSDGYQLSSQRPQGEEDDSLFAWYLPRPLTAEQLGRSIDVVINGEVSAEQALSRHLRQSIVDVMPEESVTTIKETLFLSNNESFNAYIYQSDATDRLSLQLADRPGPSERVRFLFDVVFQRAPEPDEVDKLAPLLAGDDATVEENVRHVIWSMVTSSEFRFNH